MKKPALFFLLLCIGVIKTLSAQSADHLKLSEQYPAAGEVINFTYDPAGTPLEDKPNLDVIVYFLDNKDNPAADVDLKSNGNLLIGSFAVPLNTKAFFIKIGKDKEIDSNNENGYVYLIYDGQKPVQGAYAMNAYIIYSGLGTAYGKIKKDLQAAYDLYQKEFALYPKSKDDYRYSYAMMLVASPDQLTRSMADEQIDALIKSGVEAQMTQAVGLLSRLKKIDQMDALMADIKLKFPNGTMGQSELRSAFAREKDPEKKEAAYNAFVQKYPEKPGDKRSTQDIMRLQLAIAYLQAEKFADYERVVATVKDKSMLLPSVLNSVSYAMAKKGEDLERANKLSKLSLDLTMEKINTPPPMAFQSPKTVKLGWQATYNSFADTYAFILYKQGNFKDALTYEQPIYEVQKGSDVEVNEHYAMILNGLGQNQQAIVIIEDAIKKGKSSQAMVDALKELYVKKVGSDKGYDNYLASLKAPADQGMKAELAKQMINQPAPLFALKDLHGKTVSLADLKGKVVVVDFWATWCGPCIASFPGMQQAVTKFQDNPNVVFLFIDTRQTEMNYEDLVKKFIADNNYSFKVLLDDKSTDGTQSKVLKAYEVTGIPTKFVLDANGNIRFKKIGYSGGSPESIADEVSAMIEMAAHPETVSSAAKGGIEKSK